LDLVGERREKNERGEHICDTLVPPRAGARMGGQKTGEKRLLLRGGRGSEGGSARQKSQFDWQRGGEGGQWGRNKIKNLSKSKTTGVIASKNWGGKWGRTGSSVKPKTPGIHALYTGKGRGKEPRVGGEHVK